MSLVLFICWFIHLSIHWHHKVKKNGKVWFFEKKSQWLRRVQIGQKNLFRSYLLFFVEYESLWKLHVWEKSSSWMQDSLNYNISQKIWAMNLNFCICPSNCRSTKLATIVLSGCGQAYQGIPKKWSKFVIQLNPKNELSHQADFLHLVSHS